MLATNLHISFQKTTPQTLFDPQSCYFAFQSRQNSSFLLASFAFLGRQTQSWRIRNQPEANKGIRRLRCWLPCWRLFKCFV
jgi:hypothetical protein